MKTLKVLSILTTFLLLIYGILQFLKPAIKGFSFLKIVCDNGGSPPLFIFLISSFLLLVCVGIQGKWRFPTPVLGLFLICSLGSLIVVLLYHEGYIKSEMSKNSNLHTPVLPKKKDKKSDKNAAQRVIFLSNYTLVSTAILLVLNKNTHHFLYLFPKFCSESYLWGCYIVVIGLIANLATNYKEWPLTFFLGVISVFFRMSFPKEATVICIALWLLSLIFVVNEFGKSQAVLNPTFYQKVCNGIFGKKTHSNVFLFGKTQASSVEYYLSFVYSSGLIVIIFFSWEGYCAFKY